jgi:hypothetical protein
VTGPLLAAPVVRAITDQQVSPGVLGFLVVAAIGVATWLLIRSMNRQLHKIDFTEETVEAPVEPAEPTKPDAAD